MYTVMKRKLMLLGFVICSAVYVGCSSAPTREELTSLDELRAEIRSLEQRQTDLQQRKTMLAEAIAAKEQQLRDIENKKNELLKYQ